MKQQFHHSRVQMGALTSAGLLASAAISENIHNPTLRMVCMAGMAALVCLMREAAYHSGRESFTERMEPRGFSRSR